MNRRRTTPLESLSIEKHTCTFDVRMEKMSMVPFFESLTTDQLREVHKRFSATHFAAGEEIYHQHEVATLLRIVVHGFVKLSQQAEDGRDILLEMLRPGDYFGSLSSMGQATYSDTAIAQTDVCVLSISNRDFQTVLNKHPEVAVAVLNITSEKLTRARETIHHLTALPVEKRIAHILITLSYKFGEESEYGILLQVPLSRKELADMAGTSTETASRIMSRFQQKEYITSGRQWVAIKERGALEEVLESDV